MLNKMPFKKCSFFKKTYQKFISPDSESAYLIHLIQSNIKKNHTILDVGCGNGRYLESLQKLGYSIEGVEKNIEIVGGNKKKGLICYTPVDFELTTKNNNKIILRRDRSR